MGGNNLKIDINKDFLKEYKDNFFKGFSVSEVIHLVVALGVAALIMYVAVRYLHIDIVVRCVYISAVYNPNCFFRDIYVPGLSKT
ncbi:MAG: hypothetical protein ACLRRQ_09655 [Lachnospira pectinoschiza]